MKKKTDGDRLVSVNADVTTITVVNETAQVSISSGTVSFGASPEAEMIANTIQALQSLLMSQLGIAKELSYLKNFSLQKEQKKIADCLSCEEYQKAFFDLQTKHGVLILSELPNNDSIPANTIYSYIRYDENQHPLQWVLGFNSQYLRQYADIDLVDLQKKAKIYVENNYEFLSDEYSLLDKLMELDSELNKAGSSDELLDIIARFNNQFPGQLTLEYTLDTVRDVTSFIVSDPHHCFTANFERTVNLKGTDDLSLAKALPKASKSRSHFWCTTQTASVVLAAAGAAVAAFCLS